MKTDETPHRILVLFDADREQFFFDGHYLLFLIGYIRFFSPFLFTMSHIIRFDLFCPIFLSPFFFHGRTMETLLIFLSRRDFFFFFKKTETFFALFFGIDQKICFALFFDLSFFFFLAGTTEFFLESDRNIFSRYFFLRKTETLFRTYFFNRIENFSHFLFSLVFFVQKFFFFALFFC